MADIGTYNKNPEEYQKLVDEMYENFPPITLSPEYAEFIQNNLLRFLIRLARYKFVARLLKKTDSVLEVGSGSGMGSIFLAQHSRQVTGLEVKQTEHEEAKSINRRNNVDFLCEDLFDYQPSKPFDVVCSLDVIEHMPIEDGHKFMKRIAEVTDQNGMVIIGSPSIYSYPYQSKISQASHVKCYDQQELVNLIETYFHRALPFGMNDEVTHTGHPKMTWYYFVVAYNPKQSDS